jgi:hypothetical protein
MPQDAACSEQVPPTVSQVPPAESPYIGSLAVRSRPVELVELKRITPRVWHAAEAAAWPRIRQQALLSTSALLRSR